MDGEGAKPSTHDMTKEIILPILIIIITILIKIIMIIITPLVMAHTLSKYCDARISKHFNARPPKHGDISNDDGDDDGNDDNGNLVPYLFAMTMTMTIACGAVWCTSPH